MPPLKLRVGEVTADEMMPPLETLAEEAEDAGIRGSRGDRRYVEEQVVGKNYLYLEYTQEVTEERQQFVAEEEEGGDEDADVVDVEETFVARTMRFLLRSDNRYAFESKRGVYGEDAIEFLTEDLDIDGLDTTRRQTFGREWIRSFYSGVNSVRKVRLDDIAEFDLEDFNEQTIEIVNGTGGPAERIVISTSGSSNNLRDSGLVDALSRSSGIKFVSGVNVEGNLRKLNRKGRLVLSHPADLDHEGVAERMYTATDNIFDNLDDDPDQQ